MQKPKNPHDIRITAAATNTATGNVPARIPTLCILYISTCTVYMIYMFRPDVKTSWLINRTPVDQLDAWLINRQPRCPTPWAGCTPDGHPVVRPCLEAQEKSVYCPLHIGIESVYHQAEREGQTKYVVALPGSGPVV